MDHLVSSHVPNCCGPRGQGAYKCSSGLQGPGHEFLYTPVSQEGHTGVTRLASRRLPASTLALAAHVLSPCSLLSKLLPLLLETSEAEGGAFSEATLWELQSFPKGQKCVRDPSVPSHSCQTQTLSRLILPAR